MEKFHLAYLGHSGFALELADCVLIFDYYIDPAGKLPAQRSFQPGCFSMGKAHGGIYPPQRMPFFGHA